MRLKTTLALGAAALAATASLVAPTSSAAPASAADDRANVSAFLAKKLGTMSASAPAAVMVHGATLQQARSAVTATGMQHVTSFRTIGVVVATGTRSQIQAVRSQPSGIRAIRASPSVDKVTASSASPHQT